jgi:predicted DNA-binding protein
MKHDDRISMRLPAEVATWLRRASKKAKRSASDIARDAIIQAYERRNAK